MTKRSLERNGGRASSVAALGGVLLAAWLIAGAARADAPPGRDAPAERARSIHELEARARRTVARRLDPILPASPQPRSGSLTHEVHGYHPWWMGTAYESYDWSLLSTIAFFSLELDGTGAIVDDHGWPWTGLVSAAHQHGVRVIVTATLFSSADISALLSDPARRQVAVTNLVAEVQGAGADGINVDFEGVPGARKQDLVAFLGELQSALASAIADPYLSIATPAVDWDDAFDYDELAARCDHLMVMAYDYHWSGSAFTGPVAPLGGWGTRDVPWTVQDYQTWGALPEQLLLGVPYYGYRWDTVSGSAGAQTMSSGVARTYAQAKAQADVHGSQWDAPSATPWIRWQDNGWKQLWYDDDASLRQKYDLVLAEGLAGVGIWALGYDGAHPELWTALASRFSTASDVAEDLLPTGPVLRLAGPNPFRERLDLEFSVPPPGRARLTIHDVGGRLVRTLRTPAGAGPGSVSWNGTGSTGRPVAAGHYFVRLETAEGVRAIRVVRRP